MANDQKKGQSRGRFRNFLVVLVSAILTVAIGEAVLSQFTRFGKNEKKIWIKTGTVWGSCYTSNPDRYFPIQTVDPLANTLLYCVTYDYARRKAGYFTQRKEQAAIVGDSIAFGEGLKEEDTLGYLLGERFQSINFRNFSASGKDIAYISQKVYAIIQGVKDIKTIVYFYNLNDLLTTRELKEEQNAIFDMQNIRWDEMKNRPDPLARLLSRSAISRLWERGLVFKEAGRLTTENYLEMYFGSRNSGPRRESAALLINPKGRIPRACPWVSAAP